MKDDIVLYTYPLSRGRTVQWMLEELQVPYRVELIDLPRRQQKSPAYLAINPMGKVPALSHRGVVVTESAAICAYLADAFPDAGLAPRFDDPKRGIYFRWLLFAATCIEAAVLDNLAPRRPPPNVTVPGADEVGYGTYADVVGTLDYALQPGPYILGEYFSAVDMYVYARLSYNVGKGWLPRHQRFLDYFVRLESRPAYQRMVAKCDLQLQGLGLSPFVGATSTGRQP